MSNYIWRTRVRFNNQTLLLVGLLLCAAPVLAADRAWYVGASAGVTKLSPDTDGSTYTLEDDGSTAANVYLGLEINERFSAEAAITRLGDATLSSEQSVSYNALSVGGLAYVLGKKPYHQSGLSAYVRFGLSSIDNGSDINLEKANNAAIWLGAGIQYPVSERWGLRGEIASFDGDAQAALASIYWRPGTNKAISKPSQKASEAPITAPVAMQTTASEAAPTPESANTMAVAPPPISVPAPAQIITHKPVATTATEAEVLPSPAPTVAIKPAARTGSKATVVPASGPSSAPNNKPNPKAKPAPKLLVASQVVMADSCPSGVATEPRDERGCALITGILQGVEFGADTAKLTPSAKTLLQKKAVSLNAYRNLTVEIRVHTQVYSDQALAMNLSRDRAIAVARYLAGQGVAVSRLRARAFGAAEPRATNQTAAGRRLNNRVELRVL